MNWAVQNPKVIKKISLIVTIFIMFSTQPIGIEALQDEFAIKDGYVVYKHEDNLIIADPECTEVGMDIEITENVTVDNVNSEIIQFVREITWKLSSGYQMVNDQKYDAESYGFRYLDADRRAIRKFSDTNTHTAIITEEVNKKTGIIVQLETPMDLTYITQDVYFDLDKIEGEWECASNGIWSEDMYSLLQPHSELYLEKSSEIEVGDKTAWGDVSDLKTRNGRNALLITLGLNKRYYDVESGLFLGLENNKQITISSQTVLEGEWSDSGGFIPGFKIFPVLLGFLVLIIMRRRYN